VYKEVAIMWKNKESYVDWGGVFGLSIIKHIILQQIVAHDFRYELRTFAALFPPFSTFFSISACPVLSSLVSPYQSSHNHCLHSSQSTSPAQQSHLRGQKALSAADNSQAKGRT
jgi:hypothetical protein